MKTFILKVILKEEEDGRWSASIPALSGCSSWGYSNQEALDNIKDAAEIYIEDMIDSGEGIPTPSDKIEVMEEPAIAVSLRFINLKYSRSRSSSGIEARRFPISKEERKPKGVSPPRWKTCCDSLPSS